VLADGFLCKEFTMSLRLPSRPRRRTPTFRPRIETLEDRRVLNCTTNFTGGVLTVTGDNSSNTILVNDNGANVPTFGGMTTPPTPGATPDPGTTLSLSVVCNGVTTSFPAPTAPTALTTVMISLGTKKSSVIYNLNAGLRENAKRNITVNLGKKGNDTFSMNISPTVVPNPSLPSSPIILSGLDQGSSLALTVNSGKGNEAISVEAFQDFSIAANASASITLNGGKGDDSISSNLGGNLQGPFTSSSSGTTPAAAGKLTLAMNGGGGNDNVFGILHLTGGTINATVTAKKGVENLGLMEDFDDTFQVFVTQPQFANPTHFTGSITGGGANTTCFHTKNVTVSKCKHDIIV
jgi:hypothetical protein